MFTQTNHEACQPSETKPKMDSQKEGNACRLTQSGKFASGIGYTPVFKRIGLRNRDKSRCRVLNRVWQGTPRRKLGEFAKELLLQDGAQPISARFELRPHPSAVQIANVRFGKRQKWDVERHEGDGPLRPEKAAKKETRNSKSDQRDNPVMPERCAVQDALTLRKKSTGLSQRTSRRQLAFRGTTVEEEGGVANGTHNAEVCAGVPGSGFGSPRIF